MAVGVQTTWNDIELPPAPVRRFTVEEYHRMIETDVFGPKDRVELLNGWIVHMSPHSPPHDASIHLTESIIGRNLPEGWGVRVQSSITLSESEPEPDVAVVMGDPRRYSTRHPAAADIGLLVEVSDSSLRLDRNEKGPTYAREGVPAYWIVNLPEMKVEAYSDPSATGYRQRHDYGIGESIPLVLAGSEIARIPVDELLP